MARGFNWALDEKPCSILLSPKFSFLSCLRGRWKLSAVGLFGKGNLLWCYLLLNSPHLSLLSDHSWVRSLCHVFRPPGGSFTSPQSQSKLSNKPWRNLNLNLKPKQIVPLQKAFFLNYWVCVHTHTQLVYMIQHACRNHRTTCRSWFSPTKVPSDRTQVIRLGGNQLQSCHVCLNSAFKNNISLKYLSQNVIHHQSSV